MGYQKNFCILILIVLLGGISACTGSKPTNSKSKLKSDDEIKALQYQTKALTRQIETIQKSIQSLNVKVETLSKRIDMMKQVSTVSKEYTSHKAHKNLKANKKTSYKVTPYKNETKHKLSAASKKLVVPPLKLYDMARKKYSSQKYHEAVDMFMEFVNLYPAHPYANNALYWTGESYYSLGNYEKAAFYFKSVIEKYPKGNKVPDALLKLGYTYAKLDKKKIAREYLFELMDRYPFSEAAQKAQKKLDELY